MLTFLADGNGDFAKAIDLTFDGSGNGLGTRSRRYSMLVDDGVVKKLNIEEAPGKVEVSGGMRCSAAVTRPCRPRLRGDDSKVCALTPPLRFPLSVRISSRWIASLPATMLPVTNGASPPARFVT